jgi:hypothetical protein
MSRMRLISMLLVILFLFLLSACGNADAQDKRAAKYCKTERKITESLIPAAESTHRKLNGDYTKVIVENMYAAEYYYGEAERAFRKGETETGKKYLYLAEEERKEANMWGQHAEYRAKERGIEIEFNWYKARSGIEKAKDRD